MNKERLLRIGLPVAAVIISVGVGFAGITSAQTASTSAAGTAQARGMGERPGVFGKVTAVSGSTITVTSTNPKDSTTTTYSVDASNAKVTKGSAGAAPAVSSVSAIAVGDMVAIRGTVTGTNVVATDVMDGIGGPRGGFGGKGGPGMGMGAMGTVTAVNGTTITITGKDGKTYTIDGSAAKVSKTTTISVGDIQVGDTIGARGTVSGTTVTAKDIMDGLTGQAAQGPAQK